MGKEGPCYHCGVTSTPLWRNGPPEKPVLCNACGSRWRTKDPTQSVVWDASIPSRKRSCVTRPKQSSVEKLTKDLYAIYHEQASQFSGSSEEDLLFESETPLVSVEIGHGSVLIRHPSSMAREEESEASSLSVDNKLCRTDESYSNAASLVSLNEGKSVINSFTQVGEVTRQNGQVMRLDKHKRDKYNDEKFQVLYNHNSLLNYIDLTEIVNLSVFKGYLTDGEQLGLMKHLPIVDTSEGLESLERMFTSTFFEENLASFQQLLSDGVLDTSFSVGRTEDCKVLMRLALSNSSKCKWPDHYNMVKHKAAEEGIEERISKSGTKSSSAGNLFSGKRFQESDYDLGPEAKCTMKSPKRVVLKVDYKRKGPILNRASYVTPTPTHFFALPSDGNSHVIDSLHYEGEISDQDLLLDVPSNCSFPQAELLCPISSFVSQQASASSSSIHPKP